MEKRRFVWYALVPGERTNCEIFGESQSRHKRNVSQWNKETEQVKKKPESNREKCILMGRLKKSAVRQPSDHTKWLWTHDTITTLARTDLSLCHKHVFGFHLFIYYGEENISNSSVSQKSLFKSPRWSPPPVPDPFQHSWNCTRLLRKPFDAIYKKQLLTLLKNVATSFPLTSWLYSIMSHEGPMSDVKKKPELMKLCQCVSHCCVHTPAIPWLIKSHFISARGKQSLSPL